jgi:hypothetical protein
VYPYIRYDYLHQMEAKIDVDIGHTRSDGPWNDNKFFFRFFFFFFFFFLSLKLFIKLKSLASFFVLEFIR